MLRCAHNAKLQETSKSTRRVSSSAVTVERARYRGSFVATADQRNLNKLGKNTQLSIDRNAGALGNHLQL